MKRRTFFKYLLGCGFIPFLGMAKTRPPKRPFMKPEEPELFIDIYMGCKGKEYSGRMDLGNKIKKNSKVDWREFDKMGRVLLDSGRRRLQKEGVVECFRDDDGKELIPC